MAEPILFHTKWKIMSNNVIQWNCPHQVLLTIESIPDNDEDTLAQIDVILQEPTVSGSTEIGIDASYKLLWIDGEELHENDLAILEDVVNDYVVKTY